MQICVCDIYAIVDNRSGQYKGAQIKQQITDFFQWFSNFTTNYSCWRLN